MRWKEHNVDDDTHLVVPKDYSLKRTFAEKHPILMKILQAELIVVFLIIAWFLINYFYQLGYFTKWQIPLNYLEVDLLLSSDAGVVIVYVIVLFSSMYNYVIVNFMNIKRFKLHKTKPQRKAIPLSKKRQILIYVVLAGFLDLLMNFYFNTSPTFSAYFWIALIGWTVFSFLICLPSFIFKDILSISEDMESVKRALRLLLGTALLIIVLVGVPWWMGHSSESLNKVSYNGKASNQVLMNRYRDYYLIGYTDQKNLLFPCFELIKLADDEKVQAVQKSIDDSKKEFNRYSYGAENVMIMSEKVKLEPYTKEMSPSVCKKKLDDSDQKNIQSPTIKVSN
ncbi:hypothetical protein [Thermoactinomyces sp. DSM 45892]|uniref:hypothetical protein n=1 Tax=Thermoactinomyces sp. DSM 45892 TaxID=1882753 RepID=UPI00089B925C|nr:hypothetical protein [Thermoactinomyces sp. DSM 45892]SDX96759.1 hypothetical protein SAMN05444416_101125 [Thermoactinomyces sp. DSM 45892]